MTFVGFDLHKRYITACALDDTGTIIAEIRQLPTAIEAVRGLGIIGAWRPRSTVAPSKL